MNPAEAQERLKPWMKHSEDCDTVKYATLTVACTCGLTATLLSVLYGEPPTVWEKMTP